MKLILHLILSFCGVVICSQNSGQKSIIAELGAAKSCDEIKDILKNRETLDDLRKILYAKSSYTFGISDPYLQYCFYDGIILANKQCELSNKYVQGSIDAWKTALDDKLKEIQAIEGLAWYQRLPLTFRLQDLKKDYSELLTKFDVEATKAKIGLKKESDLKEIMRVFEIKKKAEELSKNNQDFKRNLIENFLNSKK